MPRLKVYRTPIGFHDAYVAATSQKAALEAWGADANLFARGVAEIVADPKLTKEALSQPGAVIRKARGTTAEHINALPKTKAKTPHAEAGKASSSARPPRCSPPRPSREAMDQAERALTEADTRHSEERRIMVEREKALAAEKRKLDRDQQKELDRLQRAFDRAKAEYQRKLRA